MRRRTTLSLFVFLFARSSFAIGDRSALDLVRDAIQAIGGEERLRAIHVVALKAIGHRNAIEQSERPEGPYATEYVQIDEIRDFDRGRLRDDVDFRGYTTEWWRSAAWGHRSVIVEGGLAFDVTHPEKLTAASIRNVQAAEESLAFGVERLLTSALSASDLRRDPDAQLHGFTHHVVRFSSSGTTVRIWMQPVSSYPTAVELSRSRPYDIYWSPWGDVTTRITWGMWTLEPNGIHYPRLWTVESNGLPEQSLSIQEIQFNPAIAESAFPALDAVREEAAKRRIRVEDLPLGRATAPPLEVTKDVVLVPGSWNVVEVRQRDGIVIIEGPIANGYSAKVIDDARKRFPALPVKAIVTTSDAWPHIGGMREYFKRGIDVYALDLNRALLDRLANARAPKIRAISSRTTLGSGATRMELIPLRTVSGERQMLIWFPESRTLYTSDLIARRADGTWFLPQAADELLSVVKREQLEPETLFGMHYGATPWSELARR